jgi:gamma-glutamyltranspeptidase / glutathione hydrolase
MFGASPRTVSGSQMQPNRPGMFGPLLLFAWIGAGCGGLPSTPAATPEAAPTSGQEEAIVVPGQEGAGMVASAHPQATRVGVEVLEHGGNAVDAAVATAFAVGVVEPMMAGIGGSGGMLIWLADEGRAEYLDFYAVAPADPDTTFPHYDGPNHTPRGVAVPGTVAGLLEALERHGTMDRSQVLEPAIRLAREGFPVSPLLARAIEGDSAKLSQSPRAREIFWPGHRPLRAGERLVQPELAETMERIVDEGRDGFHRGAVAREIVRVLADGGNPMTEADLADFTPRWRRPLCGLYRGREVLSAPPPQSGMQIIQTLNLLGPYDLSQLGLPTHSPAALHTLATAIRTAAWDRRSFLDDPDQAAVPARALTSAGFAGQRGVLVDPEGFDLPTRVPDADPWAWEESAPPAGCVALDPFPPSDPGRRPAGPGNDPVEPGPTGESGENGPGREADRSDPSQYGETTHLSVVDDRGNAVSLTFTQGVYFGTGAWAAGTFLNSGLFIFSTEGPNRIAPGRAPASTTTPTILLRDGAAEMVVGSPGGGRIPPAVIQSIVYVLDYGMSPAAALAMPRINPQFTTPILEFEQGIPGETLAGIRERGWDPRVFPPRSLHFGGVQMLWHDGESWLGAADPRRDGYAAGAGGTRR